MCCSQIVQMPHTLQQRSGYLSKIIKLYLIDSEAQRYAARNEGAYALRKGLTGWSSMACAKKLLWIYSKAEKRPISNQTYFGSNNNILAERICDNMYPRMYSNGLIHWSAFGPVKLPLRCGGNTFSRIFRSNSRTVWY